MDGVFTLLVVLFIGAAIVGQISKANKAKGGPPAQTPSRPASSSKYARATKTTAKGSAKPARPPLRGAPVTLVAPGDNWALPWLLVLGLLVATAAALVFSA